MRITQLLIALCIAACVAIPSANAQKESENFEAKYERWNEISSRLEEIFEKFQNREGTDELRAEFGEKRKEAVELLPQLTKLAVAAYKGNPNGSQNVTDVIMMSINQEIGADNYSEAQRLIDMLLENKSDEKGLADKAGVVAFATNRFTEAKEYFDIAKEKKALTSNGARYAANIDKFIEAWKKESEIREKEAKDNDLPRVKMETTEGDIVIELYENQAPGAVGNFVSLIEKGYYDGLNFHRVLPNFMAQGGCPDGTGSGGPGYDIKCECYRDDYRKHFGGTLSMAHAGRDTGGSQFFLTFLPTPHLDGKHTAFGRIIEGMDVLAKLKKIDPGSGGEASIMKKVTVLRKRDHEYKPDKA